MAIRHEWIRSLAPSSDVPVKPACSAATLAVGESELGAGPVAWVVEASAQVAGAAGPQTSSGDLADEAEREERKFREACSLFLLVNLYTGRGPSDLTIPPEAWESCRRALAQGMPFATLLQNAWQAHGHLQQALLNVLATDTVPTGSAEENLRLAADLSQTMTTYFDALWRKSTEAWEYHQRDWEQYTSAAKREAIDRIMDQTADNGEAERVLGVRLAAHHVAVVIGEAARESLTSPTAAQVQRTLARATGDVAAQATVAELGDGVVAAWLSFSATPAEGLLTAVRQELSDLPSAWCVVGPALAGAAGFRRSHLVALRLARHARSHSRDGNSVLGMDSVRASSLLVEDDDFAGWFVRETLGNLAGLRPKDEDLRETLLQYLVCGRSLRLAAEKLHIAPNTVAYRVKHAEQLLPQRDSHDPFDLMMALSIARDLPELLTDNGGSNHLT